MNHNTNQKTNQQRQQQIFNSAQWWDTQGDFRLLHSINPVRLRWVKETCGGICGKSLLDIGCGGGIFAEAAANDGAHVLGVDASAAAIQCAQQHAAETKDENKTRQLNYQRYEGVPPQGEYDIVTCLEMLEHVPQPEAIVADIAQVLKVGGVAVFSTINRTPLAYMLAIVGLERVARALPAGSHAFDDFITPEELARWCKDAGLSVTGVVGIPYSPFGHTFLLDETRTAINYMLAARRSV